MTQEEAMGHAAKWFEGEGRDVKSLAQLLYEVAEAEFALGHADGRAFESKSAEDTTPLEALFEGPSHASDCPCLKCASRRDMAASMRRIFGRGGMR